MHDRSKLFGPDLAQFPIDRYAATGVNRFSGVFIVGNELIVRVFDLERASPAALPLAIEQDLLALVEGIHQVSLVPPERSYLAGLVHSRELENPELSAFYWIASGDPDLDSNSREHPMLELVDTNQVGPVFVPHREIKEEVFDGNFAGVSSADSGGHSLGELLGGFTGYSRNVVKVKLVKRRGGFEQMNSSGSVRSGSCRAISSR